MVHNRLVWKRSGLPAVLYLGILSAILFWSLSVGGGLETLSAAGTSSPSGSGLIRAYAVLTLVAGLSGFSMVFYGWYSRSPRSSLSLALAGGPWNWGGRTVGYLAVVSAALGLIFLVQPLFCGWLLSGNFPLRWVLDWKWCAVPVAVLGLTIAVSRIPPGFSQKRVLR